MLEKEWDQVSIHTSQTDNFEEDGARIKKSQGKEKPIEQRNIPPTYKKCYPKQQKLNNPIKPLEGLTSDLPSQMISMRIWSQKCWKDPKYNLITKQEILMIMCLTSNGQ